MNTKENNKEDKKLIPISLVILETMWGPSDGFRKLFVINPRNHSGRRLYKIFGDKKFLVGDSCPHIVSKATDHGKPCPIHLASVFEYATLRGFAPDLIVLGGKVAEATYNKVPKEERPQNCRTLYMPHPAARLWSKEMIGAAKHGIACGMDNKILMKYIGWRDYPLSSNSNK